MSAQPGLLKTPHRVWGAQGGTAGSRFEGGKQCIKKNLFFFFFPPCVCFSKQTSVFSSNGKVLDE